VGSRDKVKWDKAWLTFIVQCVYQLCLWCWYHVITLTKAYHSSSAVLLFLTW